MEIIQKLYIPVQNYPGRKRGRRKIQQQKTKREVEKQTRGKVEGEGY